MSSLHCAATLPFLVVAITGAQAASLRVGDTVQVVHNVEGLQSTDQSWSSKAEGDNIYENEFIRTKIESQARLLLVDRTGLSVGPTTTIRIDRVLYNSDRSIKSVLVSADTGAVRWTSGDSHSYLIKTPTASVTPTGTVFDLFVDSQRTFVILREGSARVCTNNQQPTCKMLANPGEMILATADELLGPRRGGPEPSDFANRCLSSRGQDCVINLTDTPRPTPSRQPPVTKTRRADTQPNRSRATEEEYVAPPRRTGYSTYYPRPYRSYARVIYTTAGTGYVVRPRPYLPNVYRPRPYPLNVYRPRPYPNFSTGQLYPRRPMMYPRRPMYQMGGGGASIR
jgi:FecR protein